MDISTITSAYTAIKSVKEITQIVLDAKVDAEVTNKVHESLNKLGEVQDALFYIREELLSQQDEKEQLIKKVKELQEELEKVESVKYITPSYWVIKDNSENDGPFCQPCFDDERKLIRLQGNGNDSWTCKKCTNIFYGPNYKAPVRRARATSSYRL